MDDIKDGGPASYDAGYGLIGGACRSVAGEHVCSNGIPIRDYFAAAALQGVLASGDETHWDGKGELEQWRESARQLEADWCYRMADAMLRARESKP